jgi:hypothetical protein
MTRASRSELTGPLCTVVYIFEREGARGGKFWFLVLACGHAVARKQPPLNVHTLFRPIEEKLAPKRVQCHYCGAGVAKKDPWPLIKALGGDAP